MRTTYSSEDVKKRTVVKKKDKADRKQRDRKRRNPR